MAELQFTVKRPECRVKGEGVKQTSQSREQCRRVISDRERERARTLPSELMINFRQRIRDAATGATDGPGSRSLHKYLEVYTSQTRSQIGSSTEAVL